MDRKTKKTAWAGAILAGAAMLTLAGAEAQAVVIFEDSFTGAPTGGTRAFVGATGVTHTITNTPPTVVGDDYYNFHVLANTNPGGGGFNIQNLDYTPTSAANSWNALIGSNISASSQQFLNINGGFDIFFRQDTGDTVGTAWLRPVDIDYRGSNGARLIFAGTGSQRMLIHLSGPAGGANEVSALTTASSAFSSFTSSAAESFLPVNTQVTISQGNVYHYGVTWSTNPTSGEIRIAVYGKPGTDAIDTTATTDLLWQRFLYADGAILNDGTGTTLPEGTWRWFSASNTAWASINVDTDIDYDVYRIHAGAVTSFAAVPEPTSLALLGLVGVAGLARRRRA